MMSTSFEKLNSMDTFEFIAGTQYTLYFEMLDASTESALDITGATLSVRISYLGQPETAVITLSGTITSAVDGEWTAVIESTDSDGLSGTFIVQPYITDFGGDVFPAQGRVVILPKIGS